MRYLQKDVQRNQIEFAFELDSQNYMVGTTWLDYMNGFWIPMSEAQVKFADEHPTATAREIFDMKMVIVELYQPPQEEENENIRLQREIAYKEESDSFYMAYVKYNELGDGEKAAAAKANWLQKVQEIDMRLPYV